MYLYIYIYIYIYMYVYISETLKPFEQCVCMYIYMETKILK